jgi:AAHS family 3-hydroxyphenylpropionic acid transporter
MTAVSAAKAIPRPWLAVPLCFAVALLEGYDIQAIGVAAPKLIPALGLNPGQAGMAFGGGMAGLVLGALAGGWLADRMGRKVLLAAAVALFGLATLGTMAAPDYLSLVAARLTTGLGLGVAMPVLVAVALEVSGPARRTRTVTAMFCGMPAGGASAALFASIAFTHLDWRTIFLVGGLLPLVLVPALIFFMPETRSERPAAAAPPAGGLSTLFGEGRALVTLLLWLTFGLTLLVLYLLLNWLPSLVTARGLPATAGAQAAMAFNLASIAGALVIGRGVDRIGPRLPVALAYLGLLVAMMGLALSAAHVPILIWAGVAGFCLLGAQYSLYGVTPMYYPAASRGLATGASVAVGRLGSIAGPLVAGQLLGLGFTAGGVAAAMAPVVMVAGIAATLMTLRAKAERE